VRPFPSHLGTVGPVEPLSADLSQRVGPALRRRSVISFSVVTNVPVHHRIERSDQGLARLGIEAAIARTRLMAPPKLVRNFEATRETVRHEPSRIHISPCRISAKPAGLLSLQAARGPLELGVVDLQLLV
jgi:hypothetical protein